MTQIDVDIHPKFLPLYQAKTDRYKVYWGGRCGLKSWACAQAAIARGSREKLNILCAREIQKSIRESVHALLVDTIKRMGLDDEWESQNDRILHRFTGTRINFIGLHNNTHNLKSYEGTDICWVEEAQAVTEKSWVDLDPTIRKEDSEIWITFNPDDELDPTYIRFVSNPRDGSFVEKTSWRDADEYGWFPESLRQQKDQMKRENFKLYLHVWEGEANSSFEDAIIQPEWVMSSLDAHITLNWEPLGAKIGSFDPADTGDDKAFCSRHGFLINDIRAWGDKELPEAIQKAYQLGSEYQVQRMVADADGLGAAMKINLDRNQKEYNLEVDMFKGGSTPDEPNAPYPPYDHSKPIQDRVVTNKQTFRNKRAQYYWFLRDRFERTHLAVQNNQWVDPEQCISISSQIDKETFKQLRRELTRIRRKQGSNSSVITLESKQEMKKSGIRSPNLADALMMVFANEEVFSGNWNLSFKSEWK